MSQFSSHHQQQSWGPTWGKACIATIILVLLAFGWSLLHGFSPIDDAFLIVRNLSIRGISPHTLYLAFSTYDPELYVPLTIISFQINYMIAGLDPWIYHATNLALHIINSMLAMALLSRITGYRNASIVAGLMFAIHPLHTEAVVWASARKDLLSTAFILLSFNLYLCRRDKQVIEHAYALSILTFFCALLSKITPFVLPAVFLLYDVLILGEKSWKKLLRKQIPYLVLSCVMAFVAMGGKEQVLTQMRIAETMLLSMKSSVFYLTKLVLPIRLSIFYPYAGEVHIGDPRIWISVAAFIGMCGWIIKARKCSPILVLGFLSYLVFLSPTFLHFRRAGDLYFAVDRYAYLPSIGFFLMVTLCLAHIARSLRAVTMRCLIVIILMIMTGLSAKQTAVWQSQTSLFTHALKNYPEATRARTNLARKLRREGKPQEAYDLLKAGIRTADAMELHLQLGYLYAETGHLPEAHAEFLIAQNMKPDDPSPLFDLASLAEQTGQKEAAMEGFAKVISMDPSFVIARIRLARLLRTEKKDLPAAQHEVETALAWNGNSAEAHAEFAAILRALGKVEEAERAYTIAQEIDPAVIMKQ
ncbi:hypothetical protein FJZ27_00370 [Candidatus Peribacteria bacterium]|nr:hypothetical protein [Candidatus Peribacteria bacterium]